MDHDKNNRSIREQNMSTHLIPVLVTTSGKNRGYFVHNRTHISQFISKSITTISLYNNKGTRFGNGETQHGAQDKNISLLGK